uniref:CCHC-type domain-containing protein n=1 Tax=Brassica oleracea var. oleracea TaxID=109376 RepID=A0A0D3CJ42_BRAOL
MKKKSKKSPPAKAKSLGSPPIENSPPPSSSSPPSRDEGSLLPPLDEFVSDAHLGSPAAVAAQQTRDKADLSPPVEPSSAKKVIVEESTDPSPGKTVTLNTQVELSSEAMSGSSSDSRPVGSVANEITVAAEPKGNLASADAKDVSLGSQLADPKEPPIRVSIEKEAKAPIDTKKTLCDRAKGVKQLSKKGEAFTLPSGEACIKIPNSVIEKNRKSWEPFVLGQFYSDPPSQGTLHNIVNGIWSKQYRDIAVSKMEGFSYLFRIPNVATRNRVIKQKLWQIEGQTMFVDKWEPGIVPTKPELTSAPIWLELRKVPLQFFNEDGLERIAGLVGHPKFLHPATANKTNLEVAKVFTIIDPRKPLPEAVNVQFDSGVINRVLVSSPWMPPVCGFCKEIGHSTRRCPTAPKSCSVCSSTDHASANCPQAPNKDTRGRKTRRSRSRNKQKWVEMDPQKAPIPPLSEQAPNGHVPPIIHTKTSLEVITLQSKLGTEKDTVRGEPSGTTGGTLSKFPRSVSATSRSS